MAGDPGAPVGWRGSAHPAVAPGLVERQAVLVDPELDRRRGRVVGHRVEVREGPAVRVETCVPVPCRGDGEGLDVDHEHPEVGRVADVQRQPADRDARREGGAVEPHVGAPVEVGAMGAVHLTPAGRTIGREPEIRFVEIPEQQQLTHLERCVQPHHVLDLLTADDSRDRPALVLPPDREVLAMLPVPARPASRVTVGGGNGGPYAHCATTRCPLCHPGARVARTGGIRWHPVITEHEAREHVLARCDVLRTVEVDLADAAGLVLAEPVVAAEDVPPFANSAVDGYAVRAADVAGAPVLLQVVGEVAAGAHTDRVVGPGEAIRIMTGAPMPAGADASVMVEETERVDGGARVRVLHAVDAGAAVRVAGDDVHAGDTVLAPGTVVTPAVAGVLATLNARRVRAIGRPRVAVLSTGDELVDDGSPLGPGQIRESNRTMLVGLVAEAGCTPVDLGIVRDDEVLLARVLRDAASTCDAIVTSGGVSMGDYDVVKAVLSHIADMRWMQIAIKPAKPFAFGTLAAGDRTVPVFGLPGNPVSSLVSFELFARPALRQMAGHKSIDRPLVRAIAGAALRRHADGKTHYVRVRGEFAHDGRYHVVSVGGQGSHQLAATATATALAIVPDGDGIPAGGEVDTIVVAW